MNIMEKKKVLRKPVKRNRFEKKHKDLAAYFRARYIALTLPELPEEDEWLLRVIEMHKEIPDNVALDEDLKKQFNRWNTPKGTTMMKDMRGKWAFSPASPPLTSWGDVRDLARIVLDVARQCC